MDKDLLPFWHEKAMTICMKRLLDCSMRIPTSEEGVSIMEQLRPRDVLSFAPKAEKESCKVASAKVQNLS